MMALIDFWPAAGAVNDCIKPEAESAEECLLLAVHQRMELMHKAAAGGAETVTDEQALFDAFVSPDLPTGTLLLPISGPSGHGKSHLIRWLDAQLRRHPRTGDFHIIRVPKSASLRSVVALILESLPAAEYPELHKAFQQAIPDFQPRAAANRLRAELQNVLGEKAAQTQAKLASASDAERKTLLPRLQHLKSLPGLLGDAALTAYFLGPDNEAVEDAPLVRLVRRAIKGKDDEFMGDKDELPKFDATSLRLPVNLVQDAATLVRSYYQTTVDRDNPIGRELALAVLNEAVDPAVRNSFNLSGQYGGYTLQDVILEIRRKLLAEGRELILLVEDFAALTGIQEVLLNICIQEAIRDGRQELCNMRTAIAVTDGYLDNWDTIRTRAKHEWAIRPAREEARVVDRVADLMGAYLNASRHGLTALRKFFAQADQGMGADAVNWLPSFSSDGSDTAMLDAFGRSSLGYPLFPFNHNAIESFCQRYLKVGGRLAFNPRAVINYILRPVLLDHRQAFLSQTFPADIDVVTPSSAVAGFIKLKLRQPPQKQAQYRSLLAHWGGNPLDGEPLRTIPRGIFEAFGLKVVEELAANGERWPEPRPGRGEEKGPVSVPTQPPAIAPGNDVTLPSPPARTPSPPLVPSVPAEDPMVAQWRQRLEEWAEGVMLDHSSANHLRKQFLRLVKNMTNWNVALLSSQDVRQFNQGVFHIPNANGNVLKDINISVADSHADEDGFLRKSFLALVRWESNNYGWAYPEGDMDALYAIELGERLSRSYLREARAQADRALLTVAPALAIQSHVLGLASMAKWSPSSLAETLTSTMPEAPVAWHDHQWSQWRRTCHDQRDALIEELLQRSACFQGTGGKPYAIDVAALWEVMKDSDVYAASLDTRALGNNNPSLSQHLGQLQSYTRRLSKNFQQELEQWNQIVNNLLGELIDKNDVHAALKDLHGKAKKLSVWPDNMDEGQVREAIRGFLNAPIQEIRERVQTMHKATTDAARVTAMGKVEPTQVKDSQDTLDVLGSFVSAMEKMMEVRMAVLADLDPKPHIDALLQSFDDAAADLAELAGDTPEAVEAGEIL